MYRKDLAASLQNHSKPVLIGIITEHFTKKYKVKDLFNSYIKCILVLLTNGNREKIVIKKHYQVIVFLFLFFFARSLQQEENGEEKEKKIKRYGVSEEFSKDNSSKKSQQNLTK